MPRQGSLARVRFIGMRVAEAMNHEASYNRKEVKSKGADRERQGEATCRAMKLNNQLWQ